MACEFILHKEDSGKAALNLIEKSLLMSQYDKLLVNLTDEAKDDTIDEVIFTKSKLENKLWGQHPSGVLKLANLLRNNQLCCVHTLVLASCDLETLPDMGTMRRSLRKLDVRGNRMTVLPDLRCVSGLEELHIQGNPVPMLPGWLADLPFILKMEAGSPHTVAISIRIIERIGYDKRYKVIVPEQFRLTLVSPPHFVLYQFKMSGGAKEITMKSAKEVMKMVKDGDIQLREEEHEEPPALFKEPREKIKFKSLEKAGVSEGPTVKKTKKQETGHENTKTEKGVEQQQKNEESDKDNGDKDNENAKKEESSADDSSSSDENSVSDSGTENSGSEQSTHESGKPHKEASSRKSQSQTSERESPEVNTAARKTDASSDEDFIDSLDIDNLDADELVELLEMDTVAGTRHESEGARKKKEKKVKRKKKTKRDKKISECEETTGIDDNLNLEDLSADMQAELAAILDLDVDMEEINAQKDPRKTGFKSSDGSTLGSEGIASSDSENSSSSSSDSSSSSSGESETDSQGGAHSQDRQRKIIAKGRTISTSSSSSSSSGSCSSSSSSSSSESDSDSDAEKPKVETAEDIIARIKGTKAQDSKSVDSKVTKVVDKKSESKKADVKRPVGKSADPDVDDIKYRKKSKKTKRVSPQKVSNDSSSSSSSSDSSDSEEGRKEDNVDADDIIAKIKSQSAQRAKDLAKKKEEERLKEEASKTKKTKEIYQAKRTVSEKKEGNTKDRFDPADEARKQKLASLKDSLASIKKEHEEVKAKRFKTKGDEQKQEDLMKNLESTRKELEQLKITMDTKKSQLDKAKDLEKEEEEARRLEHEEASKKAREQRQKEKREKTKARAQKDVPAPPAPPPPPPPVPKLTVNADETAPPVERKLPFTPADLEKGKSRLSNPNAKSRSVSPAVAKNMKKDLIGDLKDVLELRKRRGDGAGERAMKPSMVKYSDRNMAGRSPSKSPLPRSKFAK